MTVSLRLRFVILMFVLSSVFPFYSNHVITLAVKYHFLIPGSEY